MEALFVRSPGRDVPQKTVVACVRRLEPDDPIDQRVRPFGTMTDDRVALADGLASPGVAPVALESTAVSWRPVVNRRATRFTVPLVHAQHIKQLPGRKTDVKDCHQAAGVATDLVGVSARAPIRALIAGEHDPARIVELARRRRAKIPRRTRALTGRVTDPQRSQLQGLLEPGEPREPRIGRLDARILEMASPFEAEVERRATLPGVNRPAAAVSRAEVGVAMAPFPTAGSLCSWAGRSPGHPRAPAHASAGGRPRPTRG